LDKVLLVENDEGLADALAEFLRMEGFEVWHAADGRAALDQLRAADPLPDAIILDLRMPNMDGWSFRAEQRADPRLGAIPVLVTTGERSAQAKTIDAATVLQKPIDGPVLCFELRRVISAARAAAVRTRQEHTDRLTQIGRLASGLAHEINNPLGWVMSNLRTLERTLPGLLEYACAEGREEEARDVQQIISETMEGAQRIAQIVEQVRNWSALDATSSGHVDLNEVAETAAQLAEARAAGLRITRAFGEVPKVDGGPKRITQVVLNLLTNAHEAVASGGRGEGHIELRTSRITDGWALLEVIDDGPGMSEHVRRQMFDPFFTTRGSTARGLGLYVARSIVQACGGTIEVESCPGSGTCVRVLWPAAKEAEAVISSVA